MILPVLGYEMTVVSALDVYIGGCRCFLSSHILKEDSYHVTKWSRGEGSQLSSGFPGAYGKAQVARSKGLPATI